MKFPLEVGEATFDSPMHLARAVLTDARTGEATLPGADSPSAWLLMCLEDGTLEPDMVRGLAATLIQARLPGALTEGARVAAGAKMPEFADLIRLALDAHDVGLLLSPDPFFSESSVEDVLLEAWVSLAPVADPEVRAALLGRLRHAGLPRQELQVLLTSGDEDELDRWMPAVLSEGLDDHQIDALAQTIETDHGRREAVVGAIKRCQSSAWLTGQLVERHPTLEKWL